MSDFDVTVNTGYSIPTYDEVDAITTDYTSSVAASTTQTTNTLEARANALGIDVSSCTTYNVSTGATTVDEKKLNVAIQEAVKEKIRNLNDSEDAFVKTSDGTEYTKEEARTEANSTKDSINKEYTSTINEYTATLDFNASYSSEEGKLVAEWESIKDEANKLTSSITTNTTVLEGIKDFVTNLTSLVKETKNFNFDNDNNEEESEAEVPSFENILSEDYRIQTYTSESEDNTLGNNPFFESAFRTSYYEEEAAV